MLKTRTLALSCALLLLTSPATQAQDANPTTIYDEIMLNLAGNMQDILFGILVEDYAKVSNLAEAIAFHPEPDVEKKMALLKQLRVDAASFKLYQDRVRQNALKLQKAADRVDREEVLERFSALATSCTECHVSYRERVRELTRQR